MSQWNKFNVLEDEIYKLHSQSSDSDTEIMSTASPSSFPEKIYIMSHKPKTSTHLSVVLKTMDTEKRLSVDALLDSGATGLFLDTGFVKYHNLNTRKLPRAIPVYNVDGTLNKSGSIYEEVDLIMMYKNHTEKTTFAVCDLGDKSAIIGHTWLYLHNPDVNWQTGDIQFTRCPSGCQMEVKRARRKRQKIAAIQRRQLPQFDDEGDDYSEESPDSEIESEDRIFISYLHPQKQFINATSTMSQKLAEESHQQADSKKKSFEEAVPKHYHQFKSVFSKESFDRLPDRKPWDHAIELKPGSEPYRCKIYPLSPNEQKELDAFLEENLKSGRIRPSKSPMASPVFFVKKKDGSLRLVQDYRKLNEMTIKNSYPLPLISDIITKLSKAKYFTKLDVRWGFNNVRIKQGDEWKAAFRTNRGLFEPLVMFFGLTNSPATFQTMMNDIFIELIDGNMVIVYMDDILIFTETLEHHREVVKQVLQILEQNQLYLKAEKCEFEKERIEYLGLIISQGRIEMDSVKVEGVSKWPEPENVKDVQSFLGFVNFYRRFIEDFADIAKPLHELTKKGTVWRWGLRQQEAFDQLKKKVTSSPVLIFPDDNKPYKVEADSSDYATGAVLSQEGSDGKWHPVAFMSKSLSEVERNYEIHDK
ncbi:hypothetical protein D9613_011971 [Agrocybe pediades]|uniref:Reverse transcriptase domain-containing protein n=1 Tax=Agrocybe pediades TaxID=84607 RepID=A0A8H4QFA5_9AGAR|nr:hypothetical protein D9613_011971 [Agrocybe pediades]